MSGGRVVLVPLDGSKLAESVLPAAADLAARWPATLLLLHAVERKAPARVHGQPHLTEPGEAERYLTSVAAGLRRDGVQVQIHVHEPAVDDVVAGLVEHVEEVDADLVLLCTHGRGGLRDLMVGSIAQQTLARASRPVLLVRPPLPEQVAPLDRLPWAVAVDPAGHHLRDLPLVGGLARALGVRLHLLSVVPTLATLTAERRAAAVVSPAATTTLLDMEAEDTLALLQELAGHLRGERGLDVDLEVVRGEPVERVSALMAREPGCGLLAVATHGRAGLAGRLERSFAVRIVSRIRQPVLLLPLEPAPAGEGGS